MTEHIEKWLAAYHDNELKSRRLAQVEDHLEECAACRSKLEELQNLSTILQTSPPANNLTPADRFVSQVGLRLARRQERPFFQRTLQAGWQYAPIGLLSVWAFIQSTVVVSLLTITAQRFGFLKSLTGTVTKSGVAETVQSSMFASQTMIMNDIGQFLLGSFGVGNLFGLGATLKIVLPLAIALFYLIWLIGWWVPRPQNGNEINIQ